jgi:hypothetical protein
MLILLQLLVSRKIVPKLHFPSFFFSAIPDQAPTRLLSKRCSSMINSLTHCACALQRWVKETFFLTFFLAYAQQEYHKRCLCLHVETCTTLDLYPRLIINPNWTWLKHNKIDLLLRGCVTSLLTSLSNDKTFLLVLLPLPSSTCHKNQN